MADDVPTEGPVENANAPPERTFLQRFATRKNLLTLASLLSVVVGIVLGLILKAYVPLVGLDQFWLYISGETLLHLFELISAPLILTNVITGICVSNLCSSKRINGIALAYFITSTVIAVLTGFALIQIIQPGVITELVDNTPEEARLTGLEVTLDLIRNFVPRNLLRATYQQYRTQKQYVGIDQNVSGINISGLIMLSILTGIALRRMRKKGRGSGLLDLLIAVNMLTKSVVQKIMYYLPIGVVFLVATLMYEIQNKMAILIAIVMFVGVVLLGLFIHGLITIPLILLAFTRKNPFPIIKVLVPLLAKQVLLSRAAIAPYTYKCCEEELHFDRRITRFMLPIGHNINMDGTALYQMAASLFVAQLNSQLMRWTEFFVLGLAVAVASVGESGIPATRTGTTFFILGACGIPGRRASLLLIIEYLFDRINAVVNSMGDCVGVAVLEHHAQEELTNMDSTRFFDDCDEPPVPMVNPLK